jgi:hypothetical protein
MGFAYTHSNESQTDKFRILTCGYIEGTCLYRVKSFEGVFSYMFILELHCKGIYARLKFYFTKILLLLLLLLLLLFINTTTNNNNNNKGHNTPIHNILSIVPQLGICQKALENLHENGNVMPKHVGAAIYN